MFVLFDFSFTFLIINQIEIKILFKSDLKKSFVVFSFSERIFQVGKYLELRFEFRTSEMQGVILSVTEPVNFPAISIELHKGKVMCHNISCITVRSHEY